MTRLPVSSQQNRWFNTENVDDTALTLEQNYNNQKFSSIINNHFGSGVLLESLVPNTIFDSSLVSGLLDGKGVSVQFQPSDQNLGNQLSVSLTNSLAKGKRTVKILIVGLDFQNSLQYDTLIFSTNEVQITSKHYTKVLQLFFNDFIGDPKQSFNLGGRIVITEAQAMTISRDCKMVAQDVEPNIFMRDFYVTGSNTLSNVLTNALPSYNIDTLDITTGYKQLRSIIENDVTSQIGQKFLATTNNIQKITLLMSVTNGINPNDLAWTGDLIISIYPLQSSITCLTDITPSLAINFPPSNTPVAQLSTNYATLLASGVQLNTVPQPVDFIFSNTPVGSGLSIVSGNYYIVTVKRAGSANKCQIQLASGSDRVANSNLALYDGNSWIDVPEEDLWFQVWTDAAKVSDGQAYDQGNGIIIEKTYISPSTGANADYSYNQVQLSNSDTYYAVMQATTLQSGQVQDQRTGNPVNSKQQFVPTLSLINSFALLSLQNSSSPLILGTIADKNVNNYDPSSATLIEYLREYCIVKNEILIKIIDDPTDVRYDTNILSLVTEFLNGNLNGAKFIPNAANQNTFYRISKAELVSMIYGDINGDGVVDENDLLAAQQFIGANLVNIPSKSNYITLTNYFANDNLLTYQIINPITSTVLASGTDGVLVVNPQDNTQAIFTSSSASFTSIANIGSMNIVISNSLSNPQNDGTFIINGLVDAHNISIKKLYYSPDSLMQIYRADITGDMIIDSTDINYISNYVYKANPFPAVSGPGTKVGKNFNVLRISLEQFVDRKDNYTTNYLTRGSNIHVLPDVLVDGYNAGYSVYGQNLLSNPLQFNIVKQLHWYESEVAVSANQKFVPASFNYQTGYNLNNCSLNGITKEEYPPSLSFDPGRNDIFIPNNLVVNYGGELIRPDGYYHKIDMEVGNVVLELPQLSIVAEKTVNIFTDFIADYSGTGYTRLGYPAMKFADCSTVGMNALLNNQVIFSVSMQSSSPQLDGYACSNISGVIVDNRMGIYVEQTTGILHFNFANLYDDIVLQTLSSKIQITAYLKKAGWNNNPIFVSSQKMANILQLTSNTIVCGFDTLVLLS